MSADYWYRLHFKLRLYEADGQLFQRLVSDVLHARFSGFVAVAPAGALGDGGNDGFVPQEGRYFQVYGPRAGTSLRPAAMVRKAKEDFAKLRRNFPGVQRYSFVCNDRYQGVPRDVLDALAEMQEQTGLPCDPVASRDLADWFMVLPEDRRAEIVAGVPTVLPTWVDPRAVGEVLAHLAGTDAGWGATKDRAPDFDAKIRFNGLDGLAADRLRILSYQTGLIDEFLAPRGAHLAQAIAEELRQLYQQSLEGVPDHEEDAPAVRYVWMAERLIPEAARAHPHTLKAYREAAAVVLAKYFETCDIYEEPGAGRRPT